MRLSHCFALLVAQSAFAGQVVIVDGPAAGTYSEIASAVAAANEGDLLLVGPGAYASFTLDGKGLSIVAVPGTAVFVREPVIVRNVPSTSTVVLRGLSSASTGPAGSDALFVQNCVGHVRVEDCTWRGRPATIGGSTSGADGVEVRDSTRTVLVHCSMYGGKGRVGSTFIFGGSGGMGLRSWNSNVALLDASCFGGEGGAGGTGGFGGHGAFFTGGDATIAGSSLNGGPGGSVTSFA